jgi:tripartite ATP-independent transporter DctM subunit
MIPASNADAPPKLPETVFGRFLERVLQWENHLLATALAVMTVLPLLESFLRKAFHTGVPGSNSIVQHLTLLVAMLGGAVATRDRRLLSMSALPTLLKGRWKHAAALASGVTAATTAACLTYAGWTFVMAEKGSGAELVRGVALWPVQLIMPAGFALITWRLIGRCAAEWRGKLLAYALTAGFVFLAWKAPVPAEKLVWPLIGALLVMTVLGAPLFVTVGGAALIFFWGEDVTVSSVSINQYKLVTDAVLPTLPLFTLAGYFLAESGASKRLLAVFEAVVGQFRGGPAIVTCLVCAFFTTFTGASGVTILALGGLLMPVLIAEKYSERNALGLVTAAGSLGLLFPPCLPLILYAIVAKQSVTIKEMFLGGLLPGLLMVALTAALGIWQAPRDVSDRKPFTFGGAGRAIWAAKWELALPIVALVGLFGGFATPVETAALTALYAFCIQVFVYRDLKITKDVPRVMAECGLLIGGVLLILGVALGFTGYLVYAQVPDRLAEWAAANVHSRFLFLLGLNVILLFVGGLIEIYAAIVVMVPLLVPIGNKMGIDPVHLGIMFLANMELGFLAPPVGLNLLLASYRFKKPVGEVIRAVLPMLGILFFGVLLITYFEPLTTIVPRWLGK